MVQRIASEHRGTASVDDAPGTGTTFRIRLPLAPPPDAPPADAPPATVTSPRT